MVCMSAPHMAGGGEGAHTYTTMCAPPATPGADELMNAKAKGTRNEHRSMRLLESAGYSVTRAAASSYRSGEKSRLARR